MNDTQKPEDSAASSEGFSNEERDAIKERARELKAAARRGPRAQKVDDQEEVLAKIAEMREADRVIAERLHIMITTTVPTLSPKLWYGMPSYAKDGRVVCFFQSAKKFGTRYATLGFNDSAALDDGTMWPTAFALTTLTADDEARIAALVSRAAG